MAIYRNLFFLILLSALPARAQKAPTNLEKKIVYCKECHNLNGEGFHGFVEIPALAAQTDWYLQRVLKDFVSHKRDTPVSKEYMWTAVENLTSDEISGISDYFSKLSLKPAADGPTDKVAEGKDIFENGVASSNVIACTVCHGPNAEGTGAIPRLAGQLYPYLKKIFVDWQNGYWQDTWPMPVIAGSLTDDQIDALAQYLSSLN
jgi:cytochrome c553